MKHIKKKLFGESGSYWHQQIREWIRS